MTAHAQHVQSTLVQGLAVEVIHIDGGAAVVTFIGSNAFQLARDYAEWKNGKGSAKLFLVNHGRYLPAAL